MLKLEKFSPNEIHIRIRDKDQIFNPPLLKALGLALGIHLLALLLFHVSPFKIGFFENARPPAQVEADLTHDLQNLDHAILADPENEGRLARAIFERQELIPGLPALEIPRLGKVEFGSEKVGSGNPFYQIEKTVFQPELGPRWVSGLAPPVAVFLSKNLILEEMPEILRPEIGGPLEERVIYQVQVNSQTGKVFWFEIVEKTTRPELNLYAQKLLLDLHFHAEPQTFITSGEVEVHFNLEGTAS